MGEKLQKRGQKFGALHGKLQEDREGDCILFSSASVLHCPLAKCGQSSLGQCVPRKSLITLQSFYHVDSPEGIQGLISLMEASGSGSISFWINKV